MILRTSRIICLIICFWGVISGAFAQVNHYNISKVGARSTMLGGAMVGAARDHSAIFYNPGGLAFLNNSSVSAAGNMAYMDIIDLKNGAGDGIDINSFTASAAPDVVSGVIKDARRPWLTVNYALINNGLTSVDFGAKHVGQRDVISVVPGQENYSSTYNYYNKTREDWLGLSRAYKLKNDKIGLGLTVFFNWKTVRLFEQLDINVTSENPAESELIAFHDYSNRLTYTAIGVLFKFGYSQEFNNLKIGATFTSPNIPIKFISAGKLNRNQTVLIPGTAHINRKQAVFQDDVYSLNKLPYNMDVGFKYLIQNKHALYFTLAYYASVKKYSVLETYAPEAAIDSAFMDYDPNFSNVNSASAQVMNLALGYEYRFNNKLTMLYGFRTDYNYLDFSNLEYKVDFMPSYSYWDIYHFSGGANYKNKILSLDLGISVSYGNHKNGVQYINLNTPHESNELLGDLNSNVDVKYWRLGILFGFTYYFAN